MTSRWEKLAPLTGAVFFVLYVVGFALIGEVGGTSTPPAGEIVDLLEDGSTRILAGVYMSLVSVAFLLWFVGSVRSTLRGAEGSPGRLSGVAFGGGVAAGAAMAVSYAPIGQAAMRAGSDDGIGPEAALVFYDFYRAILGAAAPIGFAVLIGAAAVVSFRTQLFPPWLMWASVVIAIGLVSPLLFIFLLVAFLWVLVVGIWLFNRERVGTSGSGDAQRSD